VLSVVVQVTFLLEVFVHSGLILSSYPRNNFLRRWIPTTREELVNNLKNCSSMFHKHIWPLTSSIEIELPCPGPLNSQNTVLRKCFIITLANELCNW